MFRRKTALPSRPQPPTFEQIEEDLNCSAADVVFTIHPNNVPDGHSGTTAAGSSQPAGKSSDEQDLLGATGDGITLGDLNSMNPDACYQRVRRFIEMNDRVAGFAEVLQKKTEQLKSMRQELHSEMERVKHSLQRLPP